MSLPYFLGWVLSWLVRTLIFGTRVAGSENIPSTGGFILASNHISYYDPPLVGGCSFRTMFYFAKKELFRRSLFRWLLTVVNSLPVKRGAVDRNALKRAVDAIVQGNGLTIFPEGTRSRGQGFLKPRPGIGMIAHQAGCPIVPCFITGFDRPLACFLRRIRPTIEFGEPLTAEWVRSLEAGKSSYLEIADKVMDRISAIKERSAIK